MLFIIAYEMVIEMVAISKIIVNEWKEFPKINSSWIS